MRPRLFALCLAASCCACYSTEWLEIPHPSQIPAGGQVRVTVDGAQRELFDVFVMDDSLLVGSRPPSAPGWALPAEPIPVSRIERMDIAQREFRTVLTASLWVAGTLAFIMLMHQAGYSLGFHG